MNLNIRILVLSLIVFFADRSYSQQNSSEQQFTMPKITMPSSQAYQITKYGDVNINESSGRATTSIALRPFKVGNLEVPIGLSYVGNGVKVNQQTTWTGINWTLEAGGAITRIVKDEPDETVHQRIMPDLASIEQLNLHNGSQNVIDIIPWVQNSLDSTIDSEADVFQFSFCGHSGSFFLNANMQPVLANKDSNMKIEIIGNLATTNHFRITTGDGIKYYFGASATEESSMYGTAQGPITAKAITTYYLYKIEHFLGNSINLEYISTHVGPLVELLDRDYTISKVMEYRFRDAPPNGNCRGYTERGIQDPVIQNTRLRIEDAKILSRIYSGSKQVLFNVRNSGNPKIKDRILENILYQEGSLTVCDTKLEYLFPNGQTVADRFFLNKVIVNDRTVLDDTGHGLSGRKEIYRMEYNDPEALPERFSFKQDYLGYYNGKNNPNLFPKTNHYIFRNYNNQLADREPYFEYAQKGSLKRIYYPTGGFTEFEYEAGRRLKKPLTSPKQLEVFNNDDIPNARLTQTYILGSMLPELSSDGEIIPPWGVFEDQTITIRFSRAGEMPCDPQERDLIRFKVKDLTTNGAETVITRNVCGLTDYQHTLIQGHVYRFILELYTADPNFADGLQTISASFDYTYGYTEVDWLGLRTKRITDYTEDNAAPANTKRYYYNKAIDRSVLGKDSALQFFLPQFTSTSIVVNICSSLLGGGGVMCIENYWILYNLHSNLFQSYSSPAFDNNVQYEYVTVSYGGDNFENGGIEKKFNLQPYISGHVYHEATYVGTQLIPPSLSNNHRNDEVLQGGVLEETALVYYEGSLCKKRKTAYVYDALEILETIPNLVGQQVYIPCLYTINFDALSIVLYDTASFRKRLIAKTMTEFIAPIPLDADGALANKIVETENYTYDTANANPTEITRLTSGNEVQKIKHYYPEQHVALTGLAALDSSAYLKLVEQNRIDTPVQTESYLGTELLTTQRTLYDFWNGSTSSCFPKTIQFSKSTAALEDRAVFHAYSNGNPTEISQKDGSKTKYFYNGNHQVISKIENYTVEVPPTGTSDCEIYSSRFPGAQVTRYFYESHHNKLIQVITPDCQELSYEYDSHGRLQKIRDKDGSILKEHDLKFKIRN